MTEIKLSRREFLKAGALAAAAGATLIPKGVSAGTEYGEQGELLDPLRVSEHPAGDRNLAASEVEGLNNITPKSIVRYINERFDRFKKNPQEIARDTMILQLTSPVKNLTKRGLNDHFDHGGLGFKQEDFADIKTFARDIQKDDTQLFQKEKDECHRALVICPANGKNSDGKDLNGLGVTVLRVVDDYLKLQGQDPSSQEGSLRERSLYGRVLSDLGVRSEKPTGVLGQTGDFFAGETYMSNVDPVNGFQYEFAREVGFKTHVEIPGNGKNEETAFLKDSNNPLIIAAVVDKKGYLRVEAFDGSNTPDVLNPQWDADYGVKDMGDASKDRETGINGGRFVPPGEEVVPAGSEDRKPGDGPDDGPGDGPGDDNPNDKVRGSNREQNKGKETPDKDYYPEEVENGIDENPDNDPKYQGGN